MARSSSSRVVLIAARLVRRAEERRAGDEGGRAVKAGQEVEVKFFVRTNLAGGKEKARCVARSVGEASALAPLRARSPHHAPLRLVVSCSRSGPLSSWLKLC